MQEQKRCDNISVMMGEELSYQLERFIRRHHLSAKKFSSSSGIPLSLMERIFACRKKISLADMIQICDYLGISLDSLRYPPVHEDNYLYMENELRRMVVQRNSPQYAEMVRRFLADVHLRMTEEEAARNIRWIEYKYVKDVSVS